MVHPKGLGDLAATFTGFEPGDSLTLLMAIELGFAAEFGVDGGSTALVGALKDAYALLFGQAGKQREDASAGVVRSKPSHADYAGSIVIEGRKYWLNGWVKDGEKGKFLSLSARPAEEPTQAKPKPKPAAIEDDIPF
jgi:hypothetical protein